MRKWSSAVLILLLTTACTQYRHYDLMDPPVSDAGSPPVQPLPLRYRLSEVEADLSSRAGSAAAGFGRIGGRTVRWRSEAPQAVQRAYAGLYRSQVWMGSETLSDAEADFRVATQVQVEEETRPWIPGVLLYLLTSAAGTAAGIGLGYFLDQQGYIDDGMISGAVAGLVAGSTAGSFIPMHRATVDIKTRARMESTARSGGPRGTFYEKLHHTHRTELYSGWSGGEDGRSEFVGETVRVNQREVLDHLREVGPGTLRALVDPRSSHRPSPTPIPTDGEPTRVFVSDVTVDVEGLADLGGVLASEVQVGLQVVGPFQALTLENLEAQLRKERRNALLDCADDSCVQRIIENFGIPDTVFGRVKALGADQVHLTLTWTRGGDVLHALTEVVGREPEALLAAVRDLAARLADAVARGGDD